MYFICEILEHVWPLQILIWTLRPIRDNIYHANISCCRNTLVPLCLYVIKPKSKVKPAALTTWCTSSARTAVFSLQTHQRKTTFKSAQWKFNVGHMIIHLESFCTFSNTDKKYSLNVTADIIKSWRHFSELTLPPLERACTCTHFENWRHNHNC